MQWTSDGAAAGDVGDTASHAVVWDDASKTNFVASFALDATLAGLAVDQQIQFAANALVFTLTKAAASADDISDFGLEEALRGIFRANRYLTFHTGAPGSDGTADEIAGVDPTLLTVANLTFAHA